MKNLPREIRRRACQIKRWAADWLSGRRRKLVAPTAAPALSGSSFPVQLKLEQRILATEYAEAKIHNIQLGIRQLQNLVVPPQRILSFWLVVGRPTPARGFRPGRSLLGGRLVPDYGGGLCQLSGIIYHLSLQAGLEIIERHPHSRDIYDDEDRYTPLGADATVAYGFKDLRVLNSLSVPICFRVTVTSEKFSAALCAPVTIEPHAVEFAILSDGNGTCVVETRRRPPNGKEFQSLSVSAYRRMQG
jgi:vancomycin resistance protein VanW